MYLSLSRFTSDKITGKEVAKFTKLKYAEILTSLESFQAGDYELALRQSFHRLDETLEDTVNHPQLDISQFLTSAY